MERNEEDIVIANLQVSVSVFRIKTAKTFHLPVQEDMKRNRNRKARARRLRSDRRKRAGI
jgi:hypothetical protein